MSASASAVAMAAVDTMAWVTKNLAVAVYGRLRGVLSCLVLLCFLFVLVLFLFLVALCGGGVVDDVAAAATTAAAEASAAAAAAASAAASTSRGQHHHDLDDTAATMCFWRIGAAMFHADDECRRLVGCGYMALRSRGRLAR